MEEEVPVAEILDRSGSQSRSRGESVVRLDDSIVIQLSEPPVAVAARESLARLAKANAKLKAEKVAIAPPLSPNLAAIRAAAAYRRACAAETNLGRDEQIPGPHLELVAVLKELGLEKQYGNLREAAGGGSLTEVAALGEARFISLGIPRVRARKLLKRLFDPLSSAQPSSPRSPKRSTAPLSPFSPSTPTVGVAVTGRRAAPTLALDAALRGLDIRPALFEPTAVDVAPFSSLAPVASEAAVQTAPGQMIETAFRRRRDGSDDLSSGGVSAISGDELANQFHEFDLSEHYDALKEASLGGTSAVHLADLGLDPAATPPVSLDGASAPGKDSIGGGHDAGAAMFTGPANTAVDEQRESRLNAPHFAAAEAEPSPVRLRINNSATTEKGRSLADEAAATADDFSFSTPLDDTASAKGDKHPGSAIVKAPSLSSSSVDMHSIRPPPPQAEDGLFPRSLRCPLTGLPFVDPVLCFSDGVTYEREALLLKLRDTEGDSSARCGGSSERAREGSAADESGEGAEVARLRRLVAKLEEKLAAATTPVSSDLLEANTTQPPTPEPSGSDKASAAKTFVANSTVKVLVGEVREMIAMMHSAMVAAENEAAATAVSPGGGRSLLASTIESSDATATVVSPRDRGGPSPRKGGKPRNSSSSSSSSSNGGGPTGRATSPRRATVRGPATAAMRTSGGGGCGSRERVCAEMLSEEEAYNRDLHCVADVFAAPLKEILSRDEFKGLFGNWESLVALSDSLIGDLRKAKAAAVQIDTNDEKRNEEEKKKGREASDEGAQKSVSSSSPSSSSFAAVFSRFAPFLKACGAFLKTYEQGAELRSVFEACAVSAGSRSSAESLGSADSLDSLGSSGSSGGGVSGVSMAYVEVVRAAQRGNPRCRGLGLGSFLILPVQRVPRYKLFLEALLKETPAGHFERSEVQRALIRVSDASRHSESDATPAAVTARPPTYRTAHNSSSFSASKPSPLHRSGSPRAVRSGSPRKSPPRLSSLSSPSSSSSVSAAAAAAAASPGGGEIRANTRVATQHQTPLSPRGGTGEVGTWLKGRKTNSSKEEVLTKNNLLLSSSSSSSLLSSPQAEATTNSASQSTLPGGNGCGNSIDKALHTRNVDVSKVGDLLRRVAASEVPPVEAGNCDGDSEPQSSAEVSRSPSAALIAEKHRKNGESSVEGRASHSK